LVRPPQKREDRRRAHGRFVLSIQSWNEIAAMTATLPTNVIKSMFVSLPISNLGNARAIETELR
jgi:hypothetical protein